VFNSFDVVVVAAAVVVVVWLILCEISMAGYALK